MHESQTHRLLGLLAAPPARARSPYVFVAIDCLAVDCLKALWSLATCRAHALATALALPGLSADGSVGLGLACQPMGGLGALASVSYPARPMGGSWLATHCPWRLISGSNGPPLPGARNCRPRFGLSRELVNLPQPTTPHHAPRCPFVSWAHGRRLLRPGWLRAAHPQPGPDVEDGCLHGKP